MIKKIKKKPTVKAPAAKAKVKASPKKVSKPVAKPVKVKAAAKPAPKVAVKPAVKPVAKPAPKAPVKPAAEKLVHAARPVAVKPQAAKPVAVAPAPAPAPYQQGGRPMMNGPVVATPAPKKLAFKAGELVVYPAHGVGKIMMVEEQEIAGTKLELYIVDFEKEKLRLKVPTGRAEQKGMRRLSDKNQIEAALRVLKGRARIKRTMWSRRAQEYDAKINSGDLFAVAEVVRDLYRSERQPEQSYSERQLFEQALERMAREIAAVKKMDDDLAIKELEDYLLKNAKRPPAPGEKEEVPAEEAA